MYRVNYGKPRQTENALSLAYKSVLFLRETDFFFLVVCDPLTATFHKTTQLNTATTPQSDLNIATTMSLVNVLNMVRFPRFYAASVCVCVCVFLSHFSFLRMHLLSIDLTPPIP
jgi:hypothetical protein